MAALRQNEFSPASEAYSAKNDLRLRFFTFTWCMRQWGSASILVGNADLVTAAAENRRKRRHVETLASVVWRTIYRFNLGLRAYYFNLALLTCFIHPIFFMI